MRPLYGSHGLDLVKNKFWFTAQSSKAAGRFDYYAEKLDWSMVTEQNVTHLAHVTYDVQHIYTKNINSGTVSFFDLILMQTIVPPTGVLTPNAKPRWDWIQTLIPVGKGVEGFDDGREI